MLRLLLRLLLGREHATYDRAVHLVGHVPNLPIVILLTDGEGRQVAFLPELLMADFGRQIALKIVLAVRRFVAMPCAIASEDADLVVVPRQSILGLVEQDQ